MNKYIRDILGASGFIVLFGAFFGMATSFPDEVRTYPWVICAIGLIFSAMLLSRSVTEYKCHKGEVNQDPHMSRGQIMNIFLTMLVTVVYVVLTNIVGYFVMTFIFVVGFADYLDSKQKKWIYLLVGVIMDLILYFAFAKFLNVNLPHGFLF